MSKIASTTAASGSDPSHPQRASFSDYLHPRRNQHSWFVFRLALGFFGAALVLLPLALPQSWIASIFGLVFFLTSILLPASLASHNVATPTSTENEIPRQSHAQLILHGAEYCSEFTAPIPVQLFVSEEQILAMKSNLQPATIIPASELSAVFLQRCDNSFLLFLISSGKETVFSFRGHFAERHARKAEFAIRNLARPTPSEKPKVRAASA